MLSAKTPQSRALSWKAIFQIHVHPEGDLGRVGMAWLNSAVLLIHKSPRLKDIFKSSSKVQKCYLQILRVAV